MQTAVSLSSLPRTERTTDSSSLTINHQPSTINHSLSLLHPFLTLIRCCLSAKRPLAEEEEGRGWKTAVALQEDLATAGEQSCTTFGGCFLFNWKSAPLSGDRLR